MENTKKMDFKSETYTKWLRDVSKYAPTEEAETYTLKAIISDLEKMKRLADKMLTEKEKEDIKNYSYLCFAIDDLKETLRDYEKITDDKANISQVRAYIDGHKIPLDKAIKLFNAIKEDKPIKEA